MGLRDFALAVNTAVTATLVALALPPVAFFGFGSDELAYEQDAPRIVWVPTTGSADGKIMPAADAPPNFGVAAGTSFPTPRPLYRRRLTMECHVWAIRATPETDLDTSKDYAAAETLANHVVAAAQHVAFGSYEMGGERWTTVQAATVRRGVELVVTFVPFLIWTDELETLATVHTMPLTPEVA